MKLVKLFSLVDICFIQGLLGLSCVSIWVVAIPEAPVLFLCISGSNMTLDCGYRVSGSRDIDPRDP